MNLYDFDKTIYAKDSSIEFLFFALKHQTRLVLPSFLKFMVVFALYKIKIVPKIKAKEAMFSFLPKIKTPEKLIQQFWEHKSLDVWYLKQQKDDDVIISASPRFLITPILHKNNINHIIASEVDLKTGKFLSNNCYGEEKARRFNTKYHSCVVESAYSDSLSDRPMLDLAEKSYLISRKNGSVQIKKFQSHK